MRAASKRTCVRPANLPTFQLITPTRTRSRNGDTDAIFAAVLKRHSRGSERRCISTHHNSAQGVTATRPTRAQHLLSLAHNVSFGCIACIVQIPLTCALSVNRCWMRPIKSINGQLNKQQSDSATSPAKSGAASKANYKYTCPFRFSILFNNVALLCTVVVYLRYGYLIPLGEYTIIHALELIDCKNEFKFIYS